jgi:hypothetical protein
MKHGWWAMAFVFGVSGSFLGGCSSSDGGGGGSTSSAKLGEACSDKVPCAEGVCAGAGVCTKSCQTHYDCGCSYSTTNGDIANGLCGLACTDNECARVCSSNLDCAGGLSCTFVSPFKACQ